MSDTMDAVFGLLAVGFNLILIAALSALPVAMLVLTIDRLTGRWMTARVRCWLWLLVAVRLLMPIAPGSPVSAQLMWNLFAVGSQSASDGASTGAGLLANGPAQGFQQEKQFEYAAVLREWETVWSAEPSLEQKPYANSGLVIESSAWDWEAVLFMSLLSLWMAGVAFVMLRAVLASLRFGWGLRRIPPVEDQATIDIVLRVCDLLDVSRRPQVKYVPGLPTPALFGALRPTLCLPEETRETLSPAQLRMIVLHEAMHLRRRDGVVAWLLTVVRAAHWWNPVAWFTVRQIETYREQACDDAVRRFTEPPQRSVYAGLLLRFASGQPAASLGLLGLWFARPAKGLSARIEAFTTPDSGRRRLPWLASGALIVLLAVVGLTDAASSASESRTAAPNRTLELPPTFVWDLLDASAADQSKQASEEVEVREYDLTEAIEKYTSVPVGQDTRQWLLLIAKGFGNMLPGRPPASISIDDKDPNRLTISMTRQGHAFFTNYLDEVCRLGTSWQVCVATRVFAPSTSKRSRASTGGTR